ncbi:MAG: Gfo/Idh/MocA family oxidoreductase [Fimbriimonadaceae bacterium]|nr:Gfo/Idh/MocA family oxidoreductase [Fimbriimonadaceae bacterium]
MPVRVGVLSSAHVHAPSFVACCQASAQAEVVGLWDDEPARGQSFADGRGLAFFGDIDELCGQVDAVVVCSENMKHADQIEVASRHGLHILCEKPVAPVPDHAVRIEKAATLGKVFMTAFPCPFSPAFQLLHQKVKDGVVGRILAVNATNQGTCPFGWFIEKDKSGGGAMVDHTVHVTDLLRRLLGEEPETVQAFTGNNVYGQDWEDTAMVSVGFPSGVFATIDSSWSKPMGYKTWGNVKLTVVGEKGVVETDLFTQGYDVYTQAHRQYGVGANLDQMMVDEFLNAVIEGRSPSVTLFDGLQASRVAMAAYRSATSQGEVVLL